ncbi:glycosyltransferase [Acidimicrobiia bacterium EGI L10123]|uniref:glycosyltransferase n=1 Tax=Salinilacustrithrix flava TaxID=2957203 RepID=UPI003D7C3538|nr:glycosyltransferase [Acidimicrobiia bacterium EGI L10123]
MNEVPLVTVLVPARNEERSISRCLQAVLAQDYPHDRMEIVLVDGHSTDRTAVLAKETLSAGDIRSQVLANPLGTTPSNLNAGLAVASGGLVCRVDARSIVPPNYVRLCAELLREREDIIVTGGAQIALPLDESDRSAGIARALNNRYAMGGSRYRSGRRSGPTDTVYLGAFRTADLREANGWDEAMLTNQDYELNRRLGSHGVVWFDDRLAVGYIPRQTLRALWAQYFRFGRWKVRYWRRTGDRPQSRQLLALLAVPMALGFVGVSAARSKPRYRRCLAVAAGTIGPVWIVDALGSTSSANRRVRLVSSVTLVLVVGGWLAGVGAETFASRSRGKHDQ